MLVEIAGRYVVKGTMNYEWLQEDLLLKFFKNECERSWRRRGERWGIS